MFDSPLFLLKSASVCLFFSDVNIFGDQMAFSFIQELLDIQHLDRCFNFIYKIRITLQASWSWCYSKWFLKFLLGCRFSFEVYAKNDLKGDFANFSRKTRCKSYFRNDITEDFSETPVFHNDLLESPTRASSIGNVFKPDWRWYSQRVIALEGMVSYRGVAEDRSIMIKPTVSGSCVVFRDITYYLLET